MKITEDDIHVIHDISVGKNCGFQYNVKFLSLEGADIVWTKEQAEQLKSKILQSLRLLELVEDRINENINHPHYGEYHDKANICLRCSVLELQSLLDESKSP